jgi:hypothetical protein
MARMARPMWFMGFVVVKVLTQFLVVGSDSKGLEEMLMSLRLWGIKGPGLWLLVLHHLLFSLGLSYGKTSIHDLLMFCFLSSSQSITLTIVLHLTTFDGTARIASMHRNKASNRPILH